MTFEDTVIIKADASDVWSCLLDVNCLAACTPGAEEITQIDDRTFSGIMAATVGPISGRFAYQTEIVETDPPRHLLLELRGTDSVTSSTISAETSLDLTALAARTTQMSYHASVEVKGRLAILGEMVLRTTATLLLEEFIRRLEAHASERPGA